MDNKKFDSISQSVDKLAEYNIELKNLINSENINYSHLSFLLKDMENQTGILSMQIDKALPKSGNDSCGLTEIGKDFYFGIKLGIVVSGIYTLYLCLHK
jgi:hypothetical protein